MQGIRFDEGYKEYMINDDPNRVIRFNQTDFEILDRIKDAYEEIEKATSTEDDVELNPDGTPIISIHAPLRGATCNSFPALFNLLFQSTLPCGERRKAINTFK